MVPWRQSILSTKVICSVLQLLEVLIQSPDLRRVHVRTTSELKLDPERPEYHRATVHWKRYVALIYIQCCSQGEHPMRLMLMLQACQGSREPYWWGIHCRKHRWTDQQPPPQHALSKCSSGVPSSSWRYTQRQHGFSALDC